VHIYGSYGKIKPGYRFLDHAVRRYVQKAWLLLSMPIVLHTIMQYNCIT